MDLFLDVLQKILHETIDALKSKLNRYEERVRKEISLEKEI